MTSILKIGLILVAVTCVLVLVHPTEADDEVKRKRVIIKIPHRVKHIYHHHTKKVHIHKKKPKPTPKKKKPHKHVHVVVEEEEIVQPIKSWKSIHQAFKGKEGWSDWKAAPSSFKYANRHPENFGGSSGIKHYEEDFEFEDDHETNESRHYGKGSSSYRGGNSSFSGSRGKKSKKKGGRPSNYSFKHFEDPSYDASYEVVHHSDHDHDGYDHEYDVPRRKPKTRKSKSSSFGSSSSSSNKPKKGHIYRTSNKKPTKRPHFEDKYLEPGEYDELFDRGPAAYPERKEHPSWHERSRDVGETISGSHQRPSIWTVPKLPEVNEFIDDTNDVPDPGVSYGNTGGFYPSNFNPITTITASVVQNSPVISPASSGPQAYEPIAPAATLPQQYDSSKSIVPRPIKYPKKQKKNPGYLSQVSSTSDGQTVSYQSHVGHSSHSPSSSFQAVSYGTAKLQK